MVEGTGNGGAGSKRPLRVLLLTLGDTEYEQQRLDGAAARLNREYAGAAALAMQPWTAGFYPRDAAFQAQLLSVECDLILGIFRVALAVELPAAPERMSDGSLYPGNTVYEVLAALGARRAGGLPPVHIFRHPAPTADERVGAERTFNITFHDFGSTDDFERQLIPVLRDFLGERGAVPADAAEPPILVPPVIEPSEPAAGDSARNLAAPTRRQRRVAAPAEPAATSDRANWRFRLAIVVAGILAVLALVAVSEAVVENHREHRVIASLAQTNQRLAEAERRNAAAAHSLDEATRNMAAARRRLKLADDLVVAMVRELSRVLRTSEGMPADTVRQALHNINDAIGPLLNEGGGDPDIVVAHAGILGQFAQVYTAIGDSAQGRKTAEQAVAMLRKLTERDKSNSEWQRDLGVSLRIMGGAALRGGDDDAAATAFEEAVAISRRLAKGAPPTAIAQRELMSALSGLADAKIRGGDAAGALPLYEEATKIVRHLADADPGNAEWTRGIAVLLSKVADAKAKTGDPDGALAAFEQALMVQREVAAAAPDNPERRRYVAIILGRIGDLREEKGDTAGALAAHDEGLAIRRALAAKGKDDRQAQIDLAVGLYKVAGVTNGERRRKALQEALAILQRLDRETKLSEDQSALVETIRHALAQRR
jgi:tetratricopeptide (TPR) repeat protein